MLSEYPNYWFQFVFAFSQSEPECVLSKAIIDHIDVRSRLDKHLHDFSYFATSVPDREMEGPPAPIPNGIYIGTSIKEQPNHHWVLRPAGFMEWFVVQFVASTNEVRILVQ
jgi:hypothetical protein